MRFVFGYYEIKLFFKKNFKSIVIFSTSLMFLKSIDMFLKCSWIVLEFSLQKSLATLGKITKIWTSQEQIELLQFNKKTFFKIVKVLWFSKKTKNWQKRVNTSFNNLFKMSISMIRHKQYTKSNRNIYQKKFLGSNSPKFMQIFISWSNLPIFVKC